MGNSVPHRYFTYTWDAVYTLAFALEQADKELKENHSDISLDDFKYFDNRTAIIPQLITKYMADTDFIGVSVSCLLKVYFGPGSNYIRLTSLPAIIMGNANF